MVCLANTVCPPLHYHPVHREQESKENQHPNSNFEASSVCDQPHSSCLVYKTGLMMDLQDLSERRRVKANNADTVPIVQRWTLMLESNALFLIWMSFGGMETAAHVCPVWGFIAPSPWMKSADQRNWYTFLHAGVKPDRLVNLCWIVRSTLGVLSNHWRTEDIGTVEL